MKVFVTGATGYIGGHFVRAAMEAGHEIVALRVPGTTSKTPWPHEPVWIDGTLDDARESHLAGCRAMAHFAAVGVSPQRATWEEYMHWNVEAPLRLAERAIRAGVSRILSCGTCFEFGKVADGYEAIPANAPMEPTTAYGTSKAMATLGFEGLARTARIELATLRLFHTFGEGSHPDSFWAALKATAEKGADFPMSGGEQVRDFIAVEETSQWFLRKLDDPKLLPGQPKRINVGSGRPVTLRQFAEQWWEKWHARGRLLIGAIPYRNDEVFRYVPQIEESA